MSFSGEQEPQGMLMYTRRDWFPELQHAYLYLAVPECPTEMWYYQCVASWILFHHAYDILNWCCSFLIGASLLSFCVCWCSSGTWLCSLQTYAQEKSSWGKTWWIKDDFVASTNHNCSLTITEQYTGWSPSISGFEGNYKKNEWNQIFYVLQNTATWIAYLAAFLYHPPQRIVSSALINCFFDPGGWFPDWAVTIFILSLSSKEDMWIFISIIPDTSSGANRGDCQKNAGAK